MAKRKHGKPKRGKTTRPVTTRTFDQILEEVAEELAAAGERHAEAVSVIGNPLKLLPTKHAELAEIDRAALVGAVSTSGAIHNFCSCIAQAISRKDIRSMLKAAEGVRGMAELTHQSCQTLALIRGFQEENPIIASPTGDNNGKGATTEDPRQEDDAGGGGDTGGS